MHIQKGGTEDVVYFLENILLMLRLVSWSIFACCYTVWDVYLQSRILTTVFLWHSAVMLELYEFIGASGCLIEFDQCAYGLQLPGADCYTFCRKRTCIYSNDLSLKKLSRYCPGLSKTHKHDHAWGSIKIAGKRFSKAAAAGRYPNQLCHDWAECLANTISERFFRGTAPWSRH